jgi:hypothetical protein
MGRQYNKVIKRKRRLAYVKRKKTAIKTKIKAKVKPAA